MEVIVIGGFVRGLQGLIAAAPTMLVGLVVAAILRYYLGPEGTRRLFGGDSLKSLPQSWLLGMLLPVCSIGVLPILREMQRVGVRAGAITAFALSAPLFNPLSLLYGLTLSRPIVICGFALASLLVVTILGLIWDRIGKQPVQSSPQQAVNPIGLRRLAACCIFVSRELLGPSGLLALIAVVGLAVMGAILPHGALQASAEQLDPLAPLRMALVALPVYATPMLAMSQLGMMFAHGNSPGAAFCLLLLGTGVNTATLWWIFRNYGARSSLVWLSVLMLVILGLAYSVDRPLIPPGVEPAGHTHAFDVYTNPFHESAQINARAVGDTLAKVIGLGEAVGLVVIGVILLSGVLVRILDYYKLGNWSEQALANPAQIEGFDRVVAPQIVGITAIVGLIAFSIVGCYAYYPPPAEVLEEMRLARVETLSGATSGNVEESLRWLEVWENWSRMLEVGAAIRKFELRPYQQMQGYLLRKKLELLEHELEHDPLEPQEIRTVVQGLMETSNRLHIAFQ